MQIAFEPLPREHVAQVRATLKDVYGKTPVRVTSPGRGAPCRHCLQTIPEGKEMLILAWRPFDDASAYAETGPIFLCAECEPADAVSTLPAMLQGPRYVLRPYNSVPMIRYGLEELVDTPDLVGAAQRMMDDEKTAFIDVRNPMTGCFQCRIQRHL